MTSRRTLLPLTTVAALCALPAGAHAAAPWSPPLSVADTPVRAPSPAFGTDLGGIATLGLGGGRTRVLALSPGTTTPRSARDVSSLLDGPHPFDAGRTTSLRRSAASGGRTTVGVSDGTTSGTLGGVKALRTVKLVPGEAQLAVGPDGDAAVAFVEDRGTSTRLWFTTRRSGSSTFQAPRVIRGTGTQRDVSLAVNGDGRYVVAWAQSGAGARKVEVEARMGRTSGRGNGLLKVGPTLGEADIATIVAPTGRTTVAWTTRDGGEEQNEPLQVRAAVSRSIDFVFQPSKLLDQGGPTAYQPAEGGPSLAAAPDGTTTLAYTMSGTFTDGDVRTPVRVVTQDPSGTFGTPQQLVADGVAGRVAARADGTVAVPYVVGAAGGGDDAPLHVALRGPGAAAFGSGEEVATDADVESAVAFEPGPAGAPQVLYVRARTNGASLARRIG